MRLALFLLAASALAACSPPSTGEDAGEGRDSGFDVDAGPGERDSGLSDGGVSQPDAGLEDAGGAGGALGPFDAGQRPSGPTFGELSY